MSTIMAYISKGFSAVLMVFYNFTGNYGIAIILFALMVKLITMPFQMKSKKSMMRTSSLTPKLKELEKKYENNKTKYQEEVARIYKEEKINPMSGCIWSLIPFPILIALFSVIRMPLTYAMGLSDEAIAIVTEALGTLGADFAQKIADFAPSYSQIGIADMIYHNSSAPAVMDALAGVIPTGINYSFLGLNLGSTPQWNFFLNTNWGDVSVWLPAFGLFLLPILSGALTFLQTKISNKATPAAGAEANQMKSMMYMMPLFSVYLAFVMPGALGLYWIAQNIIGILQDLVMNKHYGKQLAVIEAERDERFRIREQVLEQKRQETERLRAEGKTQQSKNTSKRKIQSLEKAKDDERAAADKEAKRIAEGYVQPASQVGKRRYARGRAYVEDRFENPEYAEEETAAAEDMEYDDDFIEDDNFDTDDFEEVAETVDDRTISSEGKFDSSSGMEPWEQSSKKDPWEK